MSDKKQRKMSLNTPLIDDKARQAFIEEPEKKIKKPIQHELPWEKQGVIPKVIKIFNLRLPEPINLKLEWIVLNSLEYKSKHDFCFRTIEEKIEKVLYEMLK
jgi:hypothetical protein